MGKAFEGFGEGQGLYQPPFPLAHCFYKKKQCFNLNLIYRDIRLIHILGIRLIVRIPIVCNTILNEKQILKLWAGVELICALTQAWACVHLIGKHENAKDIGDNNG